MGGRVSLLFSDYAYSADGWHYIATFSFYKGKQREGYRIEGKKLLEAIAASYEKEEKGMPPKTDKIVMALELFASNTEHPHEIKNNMRETREYWKQYIPEDGVRLDQLLERL